MTSRIARARAGGSASWIAVLLMTTGLTGCNPIEGYRSLAGFNKNDPDPATALFNENLDAASSTGYPNLASVPPPPTISSTASERAQIASGLNAQRASTQAADPQGRPGTAAPGPVPPPPPIPPELVAIAGGTPPAPAVPPPPLRGANEPPLPSSPNTTLQTPQIATPLPGAEPSRPAPGQGSPSPMPAPAPSQLSAATVQSANPQPAPPPVVLPPPQVSAAAVQPAPRLPPTPVTLISLDLSLSATALTAVEQGRVVEIAARYRDKPGVVRIVAYAAPATGSAEQLNSFRAALDRAQLIAKALGAAGIPPKQIQTQAAPSTASAPPGRIDVQLLSPATGASG